jgi:hypothetical protein
LGAGPGETSREDYELLDLSYGGMCIRSRSTLRADEICEFEMNLMLLGLGLAKVKARIRWVQLPAGEYCMGGAQFLESNKGWLGSQKTMPAPVEK